MRIIYVAALAAGLAGCGSTVTVTTPTSQNCAAYQPDTRGQAVVVNADGITCDGLLPILVDTTDKPWFSTMATDGSDDPLVATMRSPSGETVMRIYAGNSSGAAQSLADELHVKGWKEVA